MAKEAAKSPNRRPVASAALALVAGCLVFAVLAALLVGVTNAVVVGGTRDSIVSAQEAAGYDADAIVVLGASVLPDGTPSQILADRVENAVELYKAGAAPKIIMSGDNSTVEYNEVLAMKDYAVSLGVPADDIFCDHAGFSTYESMHRAKSVFGADRIIVSTQRYHLYRALYAAHGLGLEAIGVAADRHTFAQQLWFDLREIPARTKDFFLAWLHTEPSFVGDPISLNQSGSVTD